MKIKRKMIVAVACGSILILSVCITILMGGSELSSSPARKEEVLRPIPTAVVQALSGNYTRSFPGSVRASRRVELAFSVPGLLEKLNADEGRSMQKGEIIAKLDQRDYQYALDMAQAKFDNSKNELARYAEMWKQEVATEVEYDNAKTAYAIAQAELNIRQKAFKDTVLHAPFDGLIVSRHVENHEHVQAKQTIVSFQDISRIEIVIQVSECLIARVGAAGLRELQVQFDADPTRWFDVVVREHSAKSDVATQTYDVVVTLVPPSDLKVFPGMTAKVRAKIIDSTATSAPGENFTLIPIEALYKGDDGKSYVWVINPTGGKPEKRHVRAMRLCANHVHISSGLKPGELVAIAALHALREDILVRPVADGKEGLDG